MRHDFPFRESVRAMPSAGLDLGLRRSPIMGFGGGHPFAKRSTGSGAIRRRLLALTLPKTVIKGTRL